MLSGKRKFLALAGALAVFASIGAAGAQANSIIPDSPTVTAVGPLFKYDYTVKLSNGRVDGGGADPSYFALYDFVGLVGLPTFTSDPSTPTGWVVTVQPTTVDPPLTSIPDSAGIPNIYVELDTAVAAGSNVTTFNGVNYFGGAGTFTLGHLIAFSMYNVSPNSNVYYGGHDHSMTTFTGNDPQIQGNAGSVPGPTAVPLPAAAWMGLGLMGVLGVIRKTRKESDV